MSDDSVYGDDLSGQCLRFSANFLGAARQASLASAIELRNAVLGAAQTSKERSVCRVQLAWWQEELQRLWQHEPRHPASKAVLAHCSVNEDTAVLMQEWLVHADRLIDGRMPDSPTDVRIAAFRQYGCTLQLALNPDGEAAVQARNCSLKLAVLSQVGSSADISDDISFALRDAETTRDVDATNAPLALLEGLCTAALRRVQHTGRPPPTLYLLWRAWRLARLHNPSTETIA